MAEKRRGLGRGIGALIPAGPDVPRPAGQSVDVFFPDNGDYRSQGDDLVEVPGARLADVELGRITANPRQPRQVFDEDALTELVDSIREVGVLQPIVVRPLPDDGTGARYELVMGERRWRASRLAGLTSIPAVVRETSDDVLLRDALLENLHRADLNPLEEASAYQQLLDDFGCTQEELSQRIGRSRPQISNTLRLLRLPPPIQRHLAAGVISAGHARALLALEAARASALSQRIVAEGLSVRSVEEIVALDATDSGRKRRALPRAGRRMPLLDDMAARLSDKFDTRVTVSLGKSKGKVTVEFASVDDLNRILSVMDPGGSPMPTGAARVSPSVD